MSTYRFHSQIVLPSGRYARLFVGPLKLARSGVPYYCIRIDDDRVFCIFQKGDDYYSGRYELSPGCDMRLGFRPARNEIVVSYDGVRTAQTARAAAASMEAITLRTATQALLNIASPDTVEHLRRFLALTLHPDRGGDASLMRDLTALIDDFERGAALAHAA